MTDVAVHNWTIIGDDALADTLRAAAPLRPAPRSITLATTANTTLPADAIVVGAAALGSSQPNVVPWLFAYEALEEARVMLRADAGKTYGCFGSYRLPRETPPDVLTQEALAPLLEATLALIDSDVTRVWACRSSLLAENDAWFVSASCRDETLLTLEALAVADPARGPELLVEVTTSEQVLRAEPFRQAVRVERLGSATAAYPWWEDVAERYLATVVAASDAPRDQSASIYAQSGRRFSCRSRVARRSCCRSAARA